MIETKEQPVAPAHSRPHRARAAVITEPGTTETREIPLTEPGPDEVRIKVEGCGLCASSIPVWEGREWFDYPQESGAPGHETWGRIDAIGKNIKGFQPGNRVAALSYHGYSEYDIAKAEHLVKLPDELKGKPFPGEPLGCAANIFKRSEIKEGQTVAIVGIGFLGALLIQMAKARGNKVIAISRRDFSLKTAKKCGADEIIKMDDHYRIIEEVKELTGGKFCERVIECTGKEWPLQLAGELTAERGKLIIAGFHQDGMRQVNIQLWNWRGIDVINAHERNPKEYVKGMKDALKMVLEGTMKPEPLYTNTYSLEELDEGFNDLCSRPDGYMKGLIINQ